MKQEQTNPIDYEKDKDGKVKFTLRSNVGGVLTLDSTIKANSLNVQTGTGPLSSSHPTIRGAMTVGSTINVPGGMGVGQNAASTAVPVAESQQPPVGELVVDGGKPKTKSAADPSPSSADSTIQVKIILILFV